MKHIALKRRFVGSRIIEALGFVVIAQQIGYIVIAGGDGADFSAGCHVVKIDTSISVSFAEHIEISAVGSKIHEVISRYVDEILVGFGSEITACFKK